MKTLSIQTLIIFLLTLVSFAACQLRPPSVAEQGELLKQGAFPAGVPPWVSSSALQGSEVKRASLGGITSTYAPPLAADSESPSLRYKDTASSFKPSLKEPEQNQPVSLPESPLDRINLLCSGLEKDVSTAITTEDLLERERKLSSLTTRCPTSFDIWLWLADTYHARGKKVEAQYGYERVLELNPENGEAKTKLESLR